jgi:hypothetical protein
MDFFEFRFARLVLGTEGRGESVDIGVVACEFTPDDESDRRASPGG